MKQKWEPADSMSFLCSLHNNLKSNKINVLITITIIKNVFYFRDESQKIRDNFKVMPFFKNHYFLGSQINKSEID